MSMINNGNEIGRAFFEDNKERGEITAEFSQMIDAQFVQMNDE